MASPQELEERKRDYEEWKWQAMAEMPEPQNRLVGSYKPDTSGKAVSGAFTPSEGLTPQRVYSLNNGAGFQTQRCKKCHSDYRVKEFEPCKPGSNAVLVCKEVNTCNRAERRNADAPCYGCEKGAWLLPLKEEYMFHRKTGPASEWELRAGLKATWTLPNMPRKSKPVAGPCQAVTLRQDKREIAGLCRTCYVDSLKRIAKGYDDGFQAAIIVRHHKDKHGNKGNVKRIIIERKISPALLAVASLENVKRKGAKAMTAKVKASKQVLAAIEYAGPVVFAATARLTGGELANLKVEARTISEARQLLAASFGLDLADFTSTIYRVDDSGEYRRVA